MDLNVGDMLNEIDRELAQNGTNIVLQWNDLAPGAVASAVDGFVDPALLVPGTATLKAFVHQVQPAGASSVRQFNEVETGDLILDLSGSADLDGKRDLIFLVKGKAYVVKEIGSKLAQSWDVTLQGAQMFRTVLLKVKT